MKERGCDYQSPFPKKRKEGRREKGGGRERERWREREREGEKTGEKRREKERRVREGEGGRNILVAVGMLVGQWAVQRL